MVTRTLTDSSSETKSDSVSLPLLSDSIEATIAAERERMMSEAGLSVGPVQHFKRPQERNFTRRERGETTIWIGGLTMRHDTLIKAGLEGLGYKVGIIPMPVKADFQAGKEYGNNGQCNPTYFTVGALVNHLKRLRDDDGVSLEEILDRHLFVTAGACGPCRFGMYEAEYRLALRNSGFDGFRVMLFQQQGGLDQAAVEAGLEFNLNFFLSLLNGIFMGDILNEVAYQIRPYELTPGATNEVFARCMDICKDALKSKSYDEVNKGVLSSIVAKFTAVKDGDDVAKILDQLRGTYYADAFDKCRRMIEEEIEVDYTKARPIVKVTGEFWAQTTEGDGNFNMFPFLEAQGAEVLVEPVATWLCYMLHQAGLKAGDRRGIQKETDAEIPIWNLKEKIKGEVNYRKKRMNLALAEKVIGREYDRLREAIGGTAHELAPQLELTRMGHPYYNSRSGGGEGHLEVAKNIYYCNKDYAHMVLSLKPFGCMPSTQSDGAQAAVVSHFRDMIYIPIETSGEGDINAHSRVQMALGEAKMKCKDEFKAAVEKTGYTIERIREFVADNRDLRRPLQQIPHTKGFISKAANFVIFVGEKMKAAGITPSATLEPVGASV
ncbi:MAG TPA: activator of (R)-2-hydroxyglutaryl-CoA dehydratase [Phycisphaerae bacterium]|nr:activator of (R)-2-hydroxyglutaryl-CoA dehydratase [Phycisphaerae bacterium]HRW54674.1 activator of (R)-2-hydroxyglutaryl-CoA dehydratase [Phycisphaerae bacterium]